MKGTIKGFLVAYFATVVQGNICCVPTKWEGFLYGKSDLLKPDSGEVETMSYDAEAKKLAVTGFIYEDGIRTSYKVISDYNKKERFIITVANNVCKKSTLASDDTFPEICVPDSATSLGTSYVGIGDKTLQVTGYLYKYTEGLFDTNVFLVVTEDGCIPISADSRGTFNSSVYYQILNYVSVTGGIKDDNVFNPPGSCNEVSQDFSDGSNLHGSTILNIF